MMTTSAVVIANHRGIAQDIQGAELPQNLNAIASHGSPGKIPGLSRPMKFTNPKSVESLSPMNRMP
jgi:hypothetical protein